MFDRRPGFWITSGLPSLVCVVLFACVSTRIPASRPVWGPLQPGACPEAGVRRYSALLHGGGQDACQGPPHDVMGAVFDQPTACEGRTGAWHVRDHSCDLAPPILPSRGADGGVSDEAEGYADLHNHLFAHLAFGQTVVWGALWGAPETALTPIPAELEGAHQRIEAFASTRGLSGLFGSHDEQGHPSYTGWPTPHLKTHQQTYVDWLFRAYQGGLRLVVAPAVNNQDMFGRGENPIGFVNDLMGLFGARATPAPDRTSNDMEALEFQVRGAHEFERWVAENQGGWLAVAETPAEAAALIESGRLAIVLGSEVDHPFNCDLGRRCEAARVEEHLDRMEALGLAVVFPTHHKENQFGDAANFQPLGTGPVRPCPEMTMDCAAIGLSAKGRHLVAEMMARGLLVDLGHAGAKPFDDTVRLLEAEGYPTQMSHASAHPLQPNGSAEYTLTVEQLRRIDALGGMVSIHGASGEYAGTDNAGARIPFGCTEGGSAFVQSYLYTRDAMKSGGRVGAGGQIALAPDWNGFADWPSGRFAEKGCRVRSSAVRTTQNGEPIGTPPPLRYPIPLPASLKRAAVGGTASLPRMEWAGKTFDFNEVGLAHVGLQPDLLEDMRLHGLSEAELDPFYRSARGFVEMWRRAREATVARDRGWLRWIPQSPTDLIDFDHLDTERLVSHAPGRTLCRLRGSGQIGSLVDGVCRVVEGSQPEAPLEISAGEIRNANSGMCLDVVRGSRRSGAAIVQSACNDSDPQRWRISRDGAADGDWRLAAQHSGLCLSGAGRAGSPLEQRPCDGSPGQRIALERIGNTFRLRPEVPAGSCAQVRDRSLRDGALVALGPCPAPGRADFHWEIDALRDAVDHELLFSTRALGGTVAWRSEPAEAFPHPVTGANGDPICRGSESLALGVLGENGCRTPSSDIEAHQLLLTTRS